MGMGIRRIPISDSTIIEESQYQRHIYSRLYIFACCVCEILMLFAFERKWISGNTYMWVWKMETKRAPKQ